MWFRKGKSTKKGGLFAQRPGMHRDLETYQIL